MIKYFDPGTFGGAMPSDNPTRIRNGFTEKNGVTTLVALMYMSANAGADE